MSGPLSINRLRTVAAVDLGATSGRVVLVGLENDRLSHREVHRFHNEPMLHTDGSLRWDWPRLVQEVRRGLDEAIRSAHVSSIGIDAWGVDYGLIDENGQLVSLPYSYRDNRSASWRDVVERLGAERIYRITGIQMMRVNTLIQLAVHEPRDLDRALRILLIPELMIHSLTGQARAEHTSASTTQMYEAINRSWSQELCGEIGVSRTLLPAIENAGTPAGHYRGVPLYLVGGHDTASAIAALPIMGDSFPAYLSSGTWSLVGVELERPELGEAAFKNNFTNEAGVFGSVRFLKNVMGLWMLDQCLKEWNVPMEVAVDEASSVSGGPIVDATDERFLNPSSMEGAIREAVPGLGSPRPHVVRCVLDSLADAYSCVLKEIEVATGRRPDVLHVIGGGSQLDLLNRLTAEACSIDVVAGPAEATALGNAVVQMIAHDWIPGLSQARELVRRSFDLRTYS